VSEVADENGGGGGGGDLADDVPADGGANGDAVLPIDPDLAPADPAPPAPERTPAPDGPSRRRPPGRQRLDVLAAIAAGGALGAPARYEITRTVHVTKGTFPWATFGTNVTGSLVLGFVLVVVIEHFPPSRYLRPFIATGFLGAYTTFSTFTVETATLVSDGHDVTGLTYLLASTAVGLAAAWIGIVAGRHSHVGGHRRSRAQMSPR